MICPQAARVVTVEQTTWGGAGRSGALPSAAAHTVASCAACSEATASAPALNRAQPSDGAAVPLAGSCGRSLPVQGPAGVTSAPRSDAADQRADDGREARRRERERRKCVTFVTKLLRESGERILFFDAMHPEQVQALIGEAADVAGGALARAQHPLSAEVAEEWADGLAQRVGPLCAGAETERKARGYFLRQVHIFSEQAMPS